MSRYPVEQFCEPPQDEFVCGICLDVLDVPTETPCRHVFCEGCIQKVLSSDGICPMCRSSFQQYGLRPALPVFKSILDQLKMRCKFELCSETIPLENYLSHINICDYVEIACPFEGCVVKCHNRDLNEHKANCDYRKIECPKHCGKKILWKATEHHIEYECANGSRRCTRCGKCNSSTDDSHDCVDYLLCALSSLQQIHQATEGEMQVLRQENFVQKEEIENLNTFKQANENMQVEMERLKQENSDQKHEMDHMQKKVERLRKKKISQKQKSDTCFRRQQRTINELRQDIAEQAKDIDNHKQIIELLKAEGELLRQEKAAQETELNAIRLEERFGMYHQNKKRKK